MYMPLSILLCFCHRYLVHVEARGGHGPLAELVDGFAEVLAGRVERRKLDGELGAAGERLGVGSLLPPAVLGRGEAGRVGAAPHAHALAVHGLRFLGVDERLACCDSFDISDINW